MAYVILDNGICFIHIPKTGGSWVRRVLAHLNPGVSHDSIQHDLPVRWDYKMIFTVVRHPAEWLGSVWAHRVREKWQDYPKRVPWQYLCQLTDPYKGLKFRPWVEKVTTELPGVVGWFYGIHAPPPVQVIRKEDQIYDFLEELGCRPKTEPPLNVGSNRIEEVGHDVREMVRKAEPETYRKYGFRD